MSHSHQRELAHYSMPFRILQKSHQNLKYFDEDKCVINKSDFYHKYPDIKIKEDGLQSQIERLSIN